MEFLCRTCLKINLTPCNIFESFKNGELISESLMRFASLEIQRDDRFPDNICENCLENLTLVQDFKLMIVDSNRKLVQRIRNPIIKNYAPIRSNTSKELFPMETIEGNDNEQESFLSYEGDTYNNYDVGENILKEKNYDSQANDTIEIINLDLEPPNCIGDSVQANLENEICTTTNWTESSMPSHEKIDNSDCEIVESHLSPTQTRTKKKASFCIVCNKYFDDKKVFKDHLLVHKKNKEFVCNTCHEIFTNMRSLMRHAVIHNERNIRLCLVCGKTFKHKGYVKTHMLIHSREKRYKCKLCPLAYDAKSSIDMHMNKHENYVQVI